MSYVISSFVLVLLAIGLWKRKVVKIHVPAMLTAFVVDVALVLWIELNRGAIEKVVESAATPMDHSLLLFHVTVSLITIVLYTVLTILGFKILKGQNELIKLHRNLAGLFVICRLTNFVTSFMVGSP